jgi:hypothetical protein
MCAADFLNIKVVFLLSYPELLIHIFTLSVIVLGVPC